MPAEEAPTITPTEVTPPVFEPVPEVTGREAVVREVTELAEQIPSEPAIPEPTVQKPIKEKVPKVTQKANDDSIVNVVREDTGLPVPEDTVQKLSDLIKQAVPIREVQENLKHEELVRRSGRASAILDTLEGKEAFARSKSALRGELPKAEFSPPELQMTDEEIKGLFNQIKDSGLQFFQKLNTAEALEKLLSGSLPTRFEIQRLENMFGSDLAKTILAKRPGGKKAWENIMEGMNLPRAVLASWDLSAPLRQGALLFWGQPAQSLPALKPMVQAFASERLTKIIDENIRTGKFAELREQAGLFQADIFSESLGLTAREENFMSRTVQKVPDLLENLVGRKILPVTKPIAEVIRVVRRSERAFATYLNKVRADVFDSYAESWEGTGKTLKDYKDLASVINIMTGRGPLGALSKSAPILSAVFFSPRLQAARVSLIPVTIKAFATKSAVRKILARNILAFVSANFTILTLAVLAGADVEADPRSADFGKIRIGNKRLDLWAGFQQYARFVVLLIQGVRKSSQTGVLTDVERDELIADFVRSKLSPVFGLASDVIENETFEGDEFSADPEFLKEQAFKRLVSIFVQDMVEAIEDSGMAGAIAALPAGFGVGFQTYGSTYWDEILDKMGQPKSTDTLPYSANVEEFNTTKDIYSLIQVRTQGLTVEDLEPQFGFPEIVKSAVDARNTKTEWQDRPNTSLFKLNTDITEGDTFEHFFIQWQELQKLTDEEEIATFKGENPQYFQGNFGDRPLSTLQLLRQYHRLNEEEQEAFIELHPELGTKARVEWLKDNPEQNALLSLWGQAPIRSLEAFNRMQSLIEELDIPDSAIPEFTLPPRESVENYFSYLDSGEEFSFNSWEVQLIVKQDDALRIWLGREPIDTPVRSLEIKIKGRDLTEERDALETDEDRATFDTENPEWVDDQRRVEAIENDGTAFEDKWVDRGHTIDQFESGSSEAMVWLLDNPDVYDWAIEQELLTDRKSELLDQEPVLRINTGWRIQDEEYDAITDPNDRLQAELRDAYLDANPEYHKQRRVRDALGIRHPDDFFRKFPVDQHDSYVNWFTDKDLKRPEGLDDRIPWFEDDYFLMENLNFYDAMIEFGVWQEEEDVLSGKKKKWSDVPLKTTVPKISTYYLDRVEGKPREDYRFENQDLDAWLVLTGRVTVPINEKRRRATLTPTERQREELARKDKEFQDILDKLRGFGR